MHNFSVSNSSSATSITASKHHYYPSTTQDSQHDTANGHPRGSSTGLLTTPYTSAEFTQILSTYYQQDELRLLSDISASQTDPFEVPATHQTVCFDDDDQGQSVNPLSLFNEPSPSQKSSQSADDVLPIVSKEQSPDPTDKWIVMSGNKNRPYQCGYKGCGRKYSVKAHLQTHFVTHTGDSKLRCYLGDCAGTIYRNTQALTWHIHAHHTFERLYGCELCDRRFRLKHHLKRHKENVHFIKSKKNHKNHRVFLNHLLLRPQLILRAQVRWLPGFLSLNRRLGNVNKAPMLVYRQLSIRRNQCKYQQIISSKPH